MPTPRSKRAKLNAKEARIESTTRISPHLIRLRCHSDALIGAELPHTDHYIKLLFLPPEADYSWPFDLTQIRAEKPREMWPVTRTYTLRTIDPETGKMDIDFVLHGDHGLAAPWAAQASPGDVFAYLGPGGAWHPDQSYQHSVFIGDETSAPAIAHALEKLPPGMTSQVLIEVADQNAEFQLCDVEGVEVQWVHRHGAVAGTELSKAVRQLVVPDIRTTWFVHGVAEMIREVRRYLFVERELARDDVSISGYWRLGMTEDQWQSSKREFNAENEAEEERLRHER
ncbi:SIP domain-containing protein [Corynebacterium sp. 3HC-13]|uniref:siderophore-interacting protein n=1 Tax=Corynebacterium poyangense TaxID=2684405 RepID=UPI001CCFE06C|nr:siderophore-interacting protein [Corynebacterium poyangense]MBZ8177113.1 SIP domain-containing protein [Corynebacterium poyangense]